MSGKHAKKERKAQREAERRAAARAERRRTILTVVAVLVVLALGSLLAFVSVDDQPLAEQPEDDSGEGHDEADEADEDADGADESGDEAGDEGDEGDAADESEVAACDPAPPPEAAGGDKPTFDEPDDVLDRQRHNTAVVETSCGELRLELDHARAPEAVNSFVFLAEQDFFDGLRIFRHAESIGALQTGAGDNTATWQIGYTLDDELEAAEEDGYPPGAVAMANSGPDSSGSQFFFVYNEEFDLDPDFTRFAMVTDGLDVLRSIAAIPTEGETPTEDVYLEDVTIRP